MPLFFRNYMQAQYYLPLWQLHSNFRDYCDVFYCVMKITVAESDPGIGLLTQHFSFTAFFWLEQKRC